MTAGTPDFSTVIQSIQVPLVPPNTNTSSLFYWRQVPLTFGSFDLAINGTSTTPVYLDFVRVTKNIIDGYRDYIEIRSGNLTATRQTIMSFYTSGDTYLKFNDVLIPDLPGDELMTVRVTRGNPSNVVTYQVGVGFYTVQL